MYAKWLVAGVLSVFLLLLVWPQPQVSLLPPPVSKEEFEKVLQRMQGEPGMKSAQFAVYVQQPGTATPLIDFNGGAAMATASTMKAITTATALQVLGADYRFATRVGHTGQLAPDGTLQGDMIIQGGGDPVLGREHLHKLFLQWAGKVKAAGVKKIEGAVIGDARIFGTQLTPDTWTWEDMGNYYGAGAAGLSVHDNLYRLYFKTGAREGDAVALLRVSPELPGLEVVSEVKTGPAGSGDNAYIYGAPYTWLRYVRGTLPPNRQEFMIKGAMPDPAWFCAWQFSRVLQQQGIEVAKPATTCRISGQQDRPTTEIFTHLSKPLAQIAKTTNYKSVNLYAEAMLRILGHQLKGEGTTEAGAEAMREYWEQKGVDMAGSFIEDGSGLSRFNALNARQMTSILALAEAADTPPENRLKALLPVVGKSGTLKYLCRNSPAAGRVYAKSGSISRVRAYTGFASTLSGKEVVFTILLNNFDKSYIEITRDVERVMNMIVRLNPA